jgi:hypothetical protein
VIFFYNSHDDIILNHQEVHSAAFLSGVEDLLNDPLVLLCCGKWDGGIVMPSSKTIQELRAAGVDNTVRAPATTRQRYDTCPPKRLYMCPPLTCALCPRAPAMTRARPAQVTAMRRAIHSPSRGWLKTFKGFVVSAEKPDDEIDADVADIYADFDEMIEWACSFRYLRPITDEGRLHSFIECLARSGYGLNLDLLEQAETFFYSCSCEHFVHYGLCKHTVSRAKFDQLITAWPPELDPTSRRGGQSNRRGRMPKSKRGNPLGTV